MKPGHIPISDAADICKKRGCAYVAVFGVRNDGEAFHVTTYGRNKALCKVAGAIGDQIADAINQGRVTPPDAHDMGHKGVWFLKGRPGLKGEKAYGAKLTPENVLEIRAVHGKGGISYSALARQFGVTPENIFRIIRRKTWSHL